MVVGSFANLDSGGDIYFYPAIAGRPIRNWIIDQMTPAEKLDALIEKEKSLLAWMQEPKSEILALLEALKRYREALEDAEEGLHLSTVDAGDDRKRTWMHQRALESLAKVKKTMNDQDAAIESLNL